MSIVKVISYAPEYLTNMVISNITKQNKKKTTKRTNKKKALWVMMTEND